MKEDKIIEITCAIIDEFEEVLEKNDITIPDSEREGDPEEAKIYGKTYYDLEDKIKNILSNTMQEI